MSVTTSEHQIEFKIFKNVLHLFVTVHSNNKAQTVDVHKNKSEVFDLEHFLTLNGKFKEHKLHASSIYNWNNSDAKHQHRLLFNSAV